MINETKIDAAFGRLADMIQSGHLLAGTDPVGFLDAVVAELKELRSENVKIRGLMSIEADKHNERQIMLQDTIEHGYSEGQTVRVIAPDLRETGVAGKITGIPGDGYICVELGSGPPWRGRYLPHEIKAL